MEETVIKPKWRKRMNHLYAESFRYIGRNFLTIFLVCLLCYTLLQLSTSGFLKCMFNLAGAINGKGYLAFNNIGEYVKSPFIILIGFGYIIILCNILFFQTAIFVYIYEQSKNKRKINYVKMLNFGFYAIKKLIHPKNWLAYVFILVIVPFADFLRFTYFNISLVVPGFILDGIRANMGFAIPYYIFVTAVVILSFMTIFDFHYFLLEDVSFFQACKKSIKIFSKHFGSIAFVMMIVFLTVFGICLLFSIIVTLLMCAFRGAMYDEVTFISYMDDYLFSAFSILILPFIYSVISCLFHYIHQENEIVFDESKMEVSKKKFTIRNSVIAAFIIGFSITDICLNIDNYSVYNTTSGVPIVIAHRGSSVEAPENSLPAFQLAIEQGADMIELDIHQTKDNVLVVTHDSNLKRVAGIDKEVYELTYEEISGINVYPDKYENVKIATLEEVFVLCKGKISIVVEIKPTSHDNHLEEDLISLIDKYDMKDEVVIHSLSTDPLMRIKELDPEIQVGYCMTLALGDIDKIEWSDFYTVEETNITPETVRKVHEAGKKIYVWTINVSDNMQYLVDCGVDGFIGDDSQMLKTNIDEITYDAGFSKFLRMLALQELVM